MPSSRDVAQLSAALKRLSAAARTDLRALLSGADLTAGPALRAALGPHWRDLVAAYGEMSSTLGADVFEMWADELGVDPKTRMVRPIDVERAEARMAWALTTDEVLGNLIILLDELVKQPARSTIQSSSHRSGLAWARVPHGDTCAFCLMLASRGAVYKTAKNAGEGTKFHGDCDCQAIPVRNADDFPRGYDPEGLYEQYRIARADAESNSSKAILSALRNVADTH